MNVTEEVEAVSQGLSEFWIQVMEFVDIYVAGFFNYSAILLNSLGVWMLTKIGLTTRSAVFMFNLMVADIVAGIVHGVIDMLELSGLRATLINNAIYCKIIYIVGFCTNFAPNYILVMFSYDRVLSFIFPYKYAYLKKRTAFAFRSCLGVTIALLASVGLNGYLIESEDGSCQVASDVPEFFRQYWYIYMLFMSSILPCMCILVLNTVIVVKSKMSRRSRNNLSEVSATRLLLLTSTSFLLMSVLSTPLYYLAQITFLQGGRSNQVAKNLVTLPATLNRFTDFPYYVIGGGTFRKKFIQMVNESINIKLSFLKKTRPDNKTGSNETEMTHQPRVSQGCLNGDEVQSNEQVAQSRSEFNRVYMDDTNNTNTLINI